MATFKSLKVTFRALALRWSLDEGLSHETLSF